MKLELKNISKSFGNELVLNDFSYTFTEGYYCILGESGIGKTTLIRTITGILRPEKGRIIRENLGDDVGMSFQGDTLLENLSAVKNVMLIAKKEIRKDLVISMLTELGLEEDFDKSVKNLSGGMKRRVSIARALVNAPKLILLDEPFQGLDVATRGKTLGFIKKHAKNSIVIVVTHDEEDVINLGATAIFLEKFER